MKIDVAQFFRNSFHAHLLQFRFKPLIMNKWSWRHVLLLSLGILWTGYSLHLYMSPAENGKLSEKAEKGKQVWQASNCHTCHQLYGLGGYLGPDLTNVYQRGGPAYIKAMVTVGSRSMPAYPMSDQDMQSLVAFLEEVNRSGSADPADFKVQPGGMIKP